MHAHDLNISAQIVLFPRIAVVMVLMVFTFQVEIFTLVFIWAELPWSIAGPTQADINILEKQTHKNWTELNYQPD